MPIEVLELPISVLSGIIVGTFVLLAAAALLATRKWILPRLNIRESDGEFGGAMVQAVLVFYALAVALIAVGSFDSHSDLSAQTSREAATIAALNRQAALYPEPVSQNMHNEIIRYTEHVIRDAFPLQAKGIVPQGGQQLIADLQSSFGRFEPKTAGQQAIQAETLRIFNQLVELRRLRLDAVGSHLSPAMWWFVLVGGALAIVSTFLFLVHDWRLHLAQVTLLSAFIGMVVVLIAAYDQPFVGSLAIGPESYELVLSMIRPSS